MSLKYNEALKLLIENLSKNPTPEQQKYMQDATEIAERLNEGFTNINSIFKGIISNWDETCRSLLMYIMYDTYLFTTSYSSFLQ